MNIAEWISNLLILGVAALIWVIAIFGLFMIISISKRAIDNIIPKGEEKWKRIWKK
tara:strand:+ start:40 stop:207 length:168 start_codon:yes stop_codon:yes gene_type:complete